ncbi:MAG: hypothetical protein ACI8UR_002014 [Natronomonas sp.]|jgi:hypothetical protein|uniref:hypothetical protein n=1 Tax=Natronomonas sp. TaxID=2184060 RepID=UPI0039893BC8
MSSSVGTSRTRVTCTDCHFSKDVEADGQAPAETIIEHGRERGHKLTIEHPDEQ